MTVVGEAVSCIVCASTRCAPAVTHGPQLRRCLDCDFVYTAVPMPAHPYDQEYFSSGGYQSYFARSKQWRYEAARRLRWLLAVTRPRNLLEIGCAAGFFLQAARGAGIAATGVEISEPAVRYARAKLTGSVVLGAFEEIEFHERFDAICAFHVLEHVADPRHFVEKMRGLIAKDGWLALEVPNIESAAARRWGPRWAGLQPQYHRWHFAPRTLAKLVWESGFSPQLCDTVHAGYYERPARRAVRRALGELRGDISVRSFRVRHPSLGDNLRLLACPRP